MSGSDAGGRELVLKLSGITKRFGPLTANGSFTAPIDDNEPKSS